jgi:hypothetical protein
MDSATPPTFGEKEATRLLEDGWGQAQILLPAPGLPAIEEGAFFVVCTHSCSVVSEDLDRDPHVEVAEARPVPRFRPRSDQARGKDVRKFHIPVEGAEFQALEVNINSRHFVNRELLLQFTPAAFYAPEDARREFAGWIARYYSRVALPNSLVARLRKKVLALLKDFVECKVGNPPAPRHEQITSIWIRFEPDAEISDDKTYLIDLLILCESHEVSDALDKEVLRLFGGQKVTMDGIELAIEVTTADETRLSDLKGWNRFPEWDHLSGMSETAATPSAN